MRAHKTHSPNGANTPALTARLFGKPPEGVAGMQPIAEHILQIPEKISTAMKEQGAELTRFHEFDDGFELSGKIGDANFFARKSGECIHVWLSNTSIKDKLESAFRACSESDLAIHGLE